MHGLAFGHWGRRGRCNRMDHRRGGGGPDRDRRRSALVLAI